MGLSERFSQQLAAAKLGSLPSIDHGPHCLPSPEQRQQYNEAELAALIEDMRTLATLAINCDVEPTIHLVRERADTATTPAPPVLSGWPLTVTPVAPAGYKANIAARTESQPAPEHTPSTSQRLARLVILGNTTQLSIADCAANPGSLPIIYAREPGPITLTLSNRSVLGPSNPFRLSTHTRNRHLATINIRAIEASATVFAVRNQLV